MAGFGGQWSTGDLSEAHAEPSCPTLHGTPETLHEANGGRLRSLARGLVTLAEAGDVDAALAVLETLRGVLDGMRPRRDGPTCWELLVADDPV